MKTIEEKAKAYDEALKDMRVIYPNLKGDVKLAVEHAFPQLRESEDEMIRRTLVEYFGPEVQLDFVRGVPIQKIREWLEKQKETPMPNSTELIEMWHKAKAILKEKDFRGDEWRLAQNAFMDGFARGTCVKFEKQKEQKPISSCDIVPYIDDKIAALQDMWREEKVAFDWDDMHEMIEDVARHFYQKEQKPNVEICPHSIKSKSYKENGYPIENCDYGLEIAYDILEKTFGEVRGYQTDDGIREHQTAIEAVRKAKEQKPLSPEEKMNHPLYLEGFDVGREVGKVEAEQKPSSGIYWHAIKKGERLPCLAYIWDHNFEKYYDFWEGRLIPNLENILIGRDTWYLPAHDVRDLPREGVDELPEEQKPTWSEEDEKILADTIFKLAGFMGNEKNIAWLKSLRPQSKTTEWNEDDEKMLWSTINGLNQDIYEKERNWLANRLKSLRPVKQEWSEEDKNKIESIKGLITMGRFADTNTIRTIWELLDSLRPSWKPSKRQIDALLIASADSKTDGLALRELYEQLLKLIQP